MSQAIESLPARRFTIEEYHRMAEAGTIGPEERVELVRGIVRGMSPKNRSHVVAAARIHGLLREALEWRAGVYQEAPLRMESLESEPEPDILVCSNPELSAYGTGETKPVLVVEVSESSLDIDLGSKALLYAEAGVLEYWVVNLTLGVLEVFREPRGGRYRSHTRLSQESTIAPEAWPAGELVVGLFFR
ncbi:MAG TPA: Uma2 family endonuclease [Vicinamibacteria bacterium]|nr:Uma2 family endonuclease [Vicinamibacteria bacterium]